MFDMWSYITDFADYMTLQTLKVFGTSAQKTEIAEKVVAVDQQAKSYDLTNFSADFKANAAKIKHFINILLVIFGLYLIFRIYRLYKSK